MKEWSIDGVGEWSNIEKQQAIQKILLMPIIASTTYFGKTKRFQSKDGEEFILSSQLYKGNSDEDMCDLAIKYYDKFYGRKIIDENGDLLSESFAGDTMIDTYKSEMNYHCLANFWLLPVGIGRSCRKYNKSRTRMDYFLKRIEDSTARFEDYYKDYFEVFPRKEFAKAHFLCNSFYETIGDSNIIVKIDNCKKASSIIIDRAKIISEYKMELYDLFIDLELIEEDDHFSNLISK